MICIYMEEVQTVQVLENFFLFDRKIFRESRLGR